MRRQVHSCTFKRKPGSASIAGTAADVAAPAIAAAKLLRNGLENVTFTGP